MQSNKFGQVIVDQDDICSLLLQGRDVCSLENLVIDHTVNLDAALDLLEHGSIIKTWQAPQDSSLSVQDFDKQCQSNWYMPDDYKKLDVAEHVLNLCQSPQELQRVGQELMLYQEHGLFDLLRFLKYLVDVMTENNIIWGVGRGSSVASHVLYLLGVHRINSMHYDLDIKEFLR